MSRKVYPDGTIRTSKSGAKFIKVNGKWEYLKIPRDQWKPQPNQVSDERREEIRRLVKEGKSYEYISKTLKCNKSTIVKYCKDLRIEYPPVKIPENMKETSYAGYYITKEGDAYREPGKYDRNGQHGEINEYGLIYLKPGYKGNPKYPEHRYECVNISIKDKNGKFVKQISKTIHQLVAEAFVPNPEGHIEIDHKDRNNKNNHYTNLIWCTHGENMKNKEFETYKITDMISGETWEGRNLMEWARNYHHLVEPRMRKETKDRGWNYIGKQLSVCRHKGHTFHKFKVEY